MRAGTSMPGFSLGGISQMQSPAGFTFMASDVDHDARPPAALGALERELVEGDRLGVGAELRVRWIEDAALHARPPAGRGRSPRSPTFVRV